jgi:transposase
MLPHEALAIYHAGPQAVVKTICDFTDTINLQHEKIRSLENKIAQLSKNSSNSSKRPSSDDITKKPPKKNKNDKKRKIGGQPGHDMHIRLAFSEDEIDKTHQYILNQCLVCNKEVSMVDAPPRVIQQIELVKFPTIKEQHLSYPVWCPNCQRIHYMPFPPNVVKEGLFKEKITALVAYMKHVNHASFSTIRKFIRDILHETVSRGYLRKIIEKVSLSLEAPYNELLDRLPLETQINVDETGHKENKKKFWTWVFKAELYVLFKIDKSRGSKVLIDVLGKEFNGALGCDYFSAYRKYMKDFDVTMQFCIAHLIRDIRYLTTLPDKETKAYGKRLLDKVKNMFKVIHEHDSMTPEDFTNALELAKEQIIATATKDVPSRRNKDGKEQKRHARNMANRFLDHGREYFTFITTPGIGPTNNVAEQAIRFIVIDRHITQGTRSIKGRKSSERIWTVIATCALQGRSAFNFILEAVRAYFHAQPSPSLLSESDSTVPSTPPSNPP